MYKKNKSNTDSPDIGKMQEVVIDFRTKIYINPDADPEEAKARYLLRRKEKLA